MSKYDDRLEIKSSGRLPNIVTVDNIFTTRFARNPQISRVLTDMELVRELNEGIPRVFQVMKEAGLPEPKIIETAANVTVVLFNGKESTEKTTEKTTEKILKIIAEGSDVTSTKIADELGLTADGVDYNMRKLKEQGLVVRVGGRKEGHWEIKK